MPKLASKQSTHIIRTPPYTSPHTHNACLHVYTLMFILALSAHTVILESLPGAPAVDEETVLWSEERKSLTKVTYFTCCMHNI